MEKTKQFFKKNIKRKRFWIISGIILLFIAYLVLRPVDNSKNTTTDFAKYIDLKQTVLATGQVVSNVDLDLSFHSRGTVKTIDVKLGDSVKKGQVLATLDQAQERASLTSARGTLAAANARLKRVLEGAEVTMAKISLENAKRDYENIKRTQETLVKNAYSNMLNSTPEAIPENGTSDYEAPTISGNYNLGKEGVIKLKLYRSSGGYSYDASGLVSGSGEINTITAQPIGNSGLYIKFPSDDTIDVIDWIIEIPNKQAVDYLVNYNAYQSSLKTQESTIALAESQVEQRQADFDLKTIMAGGSEIDLAQADVLSAQGVVEQALANYNDGVIFAPAPGTITSINIKVGELVETGSKAIVLEDVVSLYIETNINEANINSLSIGQPVDITFDAFGTEKIFKGLITKIDLSSTLIGGVVNYKVEASVEDVPDLRPGMTANMTIKTKEKSHIITVPSRAIITEKDGSKTIRLVTNTKIKKYKSVPVITGMEGDGGLVEIVSGLNEGDEYVVLIKNK